MQRHIHLQNSKILFRTSNLTNFLLVFVPVIYSENRFCFSKLLRVTTTFGRNPVSRILRNWYRSTPVGISGHPIRSVWLHGENWRHLNDFPANLRGIHYFTIQRYRAFDLPHEFGGKPESFLGGKFIVVRKTNVPIGLHTARSKTVTHLKLWPTSLACTITPPEKRTNSRLVIIVRKSVVRVKSHVKRMATSRRRKAGDEVWRRTGNALPCYVARWKYLADVFSGDESIKILYLRRYSVYAAHTAARAAVYRFGPYDGERFVVKKK